MQNQSDNGVEFNTPSAIPKGNRALFLDDKKSVLADIEKELSEIHIKVFLATSAEEGLNIVDEEDGIDVVGCDLRISDMDGVDFLKEVREISPDSNRMIFSDDVGRHEVTRALTRGYASHYFIKPWKPRELKCSVEHILKVRRTLKRKSVADTICEIDKLPSLPTVYQEFIEAVFLEKSVSEIAKIIDKDVSLSTRLLHTANSAAYGASNIFSVEGAVMRLGLNSVKDMILAFSFAGEVEWSSDQLMHLESVFQHSTRVNRYMKTVYELRQGSPMKQDFASVGITHDLGKIIALQYFPERFDAIVEKQRRRPGMSFYESERYDGQSTFRHEEVGAYFLHMWELPDLLVDAALFHHQPEKAGEQNMPIIEALAFANSLVTRVELMQEGDEINLAGLNSKVIPKNMMMDLAREIQAEIESPAEPVF